MNKRPISTLSLMRRIFMRDITVAWRRRSDIISVFFFFIIAASLFPFGLGADPQLLHAIAPSVLWVCALLSCMLSLPCMFEADYVDGTLEQLIISKQPTLLIALMKVIASSRRRASSSLGSLNSPKTFVRFLPMLLWLI